MLVIPQLWLHVLREEHVLHQFREENQGDFRMAKAWHIFVICFGSLVIAGCAGDTAGVNRADALGLVDPANLQGLPPLPPVVMPVDGNDGQYRTRFAEQWMSRSDILCRQYKDRLMMVSRDTRFTSNVAQLILSGVATFVTPLSTAHALAGAATMVGGVGAEFDADFFQKQSGEILASAIQTARENQANQIEKNLIEMSPEKYSIYRVQRDVTEYHNMCSLETALAQIRAALKASAPDGGITPPARQGVQTNTLQAGVAQAGANAEVNDRMTAGALAGAAVAPSMGLTPAEGAARGAVAGAAAPSSPGHSAATAAGSATVAGTAPVPSGSTRLAPIVMTPELSQLLVALGSDATGKKKFNKDRIKTMRQLCFVKMGIPSATATTDFLYGPNFKTRFAEMTGCVNRGGAL